MNKSNIEMLFKTFINSYHYKNHKCRIYNDNLSSIILTNNEYNLFLEKFNKKNILNLVSPIILSEQLYIKKKILNEIKLGCNQYIIFNSGYDMFAYMNNYDKLITFEIDNKDIIEDKINRLKLNNIDFKNANYIVADIKNYFSFILLKSKYNKEKKSFSNLMGLYNILNKEEFEILIKRLSNIICLNSVIVFDFDNSISNKEIIKILEKNNLYIYESLNNDEINNSYLNLYNMFNPSDRMYINDKIKFYLVIKK